MPGETPDWGVLSSQVTVFPMNDLGELAVRLGSIVTFDRRGDVIMLEDFEHGLNRWSLNVAGGASAIDLSTAWHRSGDFSCRLVAVTNGLTATQMLRALALPVLSRLGLEWSFNLPDVIGDLSLRLNLYDGINVTDFRVRWRDGDNDLQYWSSAGAWVTFATNVDLSTTNVAVHTAKLVVDGPNAQYSRFLLDNNVYSLANIAGRQTAAAALTRFDVIFELIADAGETRTAYLDDVIATQNEPA